jgi:cytochrome c peroxidase
MPPSRPRFGRSSLLKIAPAAFVASLVALFSILALQAEPARADGPVASPAPYPHTPWLLATLGRNLFFDTTLSTPVGQSCGSCHAPEAGFTFPISHINRIFGTPFGAIPTRFGPRNVPTIGYAAFVPPGPHTQGDGVATFVAGLFWDGHASTLEDQARLPFLHPNEMNNLVHNVGSPALVVDKLRSGPNADLFRRVFGQNVFSESTDDVYSHLVDAIAAYERSPEVSPFSSKFDAFIAGRATLTPNELDGFRLVTGTMDGRSTGQPYHKFAQCTACHVIPDDLSEGPFLWTGFSYANLGVPKNPLNPFYSQTNAATNPVGYNPLGRDFIDLGLGDFIYPLNGLPPGNMGPGSDGNGDFLAVNGTFRTQSFRNTDKRPHPGFVKAYMHNGAFKSLKQVVHFYNTRNLTTYPGEIIDFTQPDPYAHLRGSPLWPRPEFPSPDSMENPSGIPASAGGQIGNLGLTDQEEDHIVDFLKTLTDGFF